MQVARETGRAIPYLGKGGERQLDLPEAHVRTAQRQLQSK